MHPVWNPFIKPGEAAFLHGACYLLYDRGHNNLAEEIERVLHTPHYDDWEIRELVCLGALESKYREDGALKYFQYVDNEHWEYHATEGAKKARLTRLLGSDTSSSSCSDINDDL